MSGQTMATLPLARRALPDQGRVDVWVSDLGQLPLAGPGGNMLPSHRRSQRKLRQRFVLRLLLGSYLGCPGKAVQFERGPSGKPALAASLAGSGLRFNLSHSGDWLAVAVGRDMDLGVDIEYLRELPRADALAQRFLSPAEAQAVASLDQPARSQRFFDFWTRREALVKAMGASMVASLGQIRLDPASGRPLALPAGWPALADWTLDRPAWPAALIGALAVPGPLAGCATICLDCRGPSPGSGLSDRPA
ncbi:MAG: 4'-phosphopantetheinyl transferase family protein [Wenzhouxiangella sp.]